MIIKLNKNNFNNIIVKQIHRNIEINKKIGSLTNGMCSFMVMVINFEMAVLLNIFLYCGN